MECDCRHAWDSPSASRYGRAVGARRERRYNGPVSPLTTRRDPAPRNKAVLAVGRTWRIY